VASGANPPGDVRLDLLGGPAPSSGATLTSLESPRSSSVLQVPPPLLLWSRPQEPIASAHEIHLVARRQAHPAVTPRAQPLATLSSTPPPEQTLRRCNCGAARTLEPSSTDVVEPVANPIRAKLRASDAPRPNRVSRVLRDLLHALDETTRTRWVQTVHSPIPKGVPVGVSHMAIPPTSASTRAPAQRSRRAERLFAATMADLISDLVRPGTG